MLLTVSNSFVVAVDPGSWFVVRGSMLCVRGGSGGRVGGLPGCRAGQGRAEKKKLAGNNKSDVSVNRKKGGMCV